MTTQSVGNKVICQFKITRNFLAANLSKDCFTTPINNPLYCDILFKYVVSCVKKFFLETMMFEISFESQTMGKKKLTTLHCIGNLNLWKKENANQVDEEISGSNKMTEELARINSDEVVDFECKIT